MARPNEVSGEERLIARYFRPLAKHPAALGLFDDAAALEPPAGCDLVLKTDGVARKALRVNLSDLAAKGARPLGFLLALALPREIGPTWLEPFSRGLGEDAELFGCPLLGGTPTAHPAPHNLDCRPRRSRSWQDGAAERGQAGRSGGGD